MSRPIRELPSAGDRWEEITEVLRLRRPALFLDFDGTLAPIVDDPDEAALPVGTRAAVERLRDRCPFTVMSGRDADDVRARVGIEGLVYAGSHGFDVVWPDGRRDQRGLEYLDSLEAARVQLHREIAAIPGAELEPKRFAVAVHYRRVPRDRVGEVVMAADRIAERFVDLRRTGGKQVVELRPDLDWDKGRALRWLLEDLGLEDPDVVPVYIGDDLTDEDAFAALRDHGRGLSLVVRGEDDARATLGDYSVTDVAQTGTILRDLADLLDRS
jgi:trehalose 6-phosphate phosphatase